jgi:ATP-binding cassette subfamily B protein/subfamily B ATP-binding cassette protein MsbA
MLKGYFRLWPVVYPFRRTLIITILLSLVMAVLSLGLPLLIKILVDSLNGVNFETAYPDIIARLNGYFGADPVLAILRDQSKVFKWVGLAFPIYFFSLGIVRFYYFYQLRFMEERITNEIRYMLMDRLMRLSPKFFLQNSSGSGGLLSRSLNDTLVIQAGLQFYTDLLREPLMAVAAIAYMFTVNWKITLFCLTFLPVFATMIRIMTKTLRSLAHRGLDAMETVTKNLKEGLDGMRVIQSFNLENHMRFKFRESIDTYNYIRRKVIKRTELASPLNEFIVSILIAAIVIWVGHMIVGGEMMTSDFVTFLAAAGALDKPVKKIQQASVQIQPTTAALDRVFEIIESSEAVKEISNPKPIPKDWKTIDFKNVSFSYGGAKVLKNVDLQVQRGEIIALVGESGSGKSTLVNLLERFFDPTEGQIYLDGTPISDFAVKDLRDQVALVTQDVFLFDATIEDNIRAGNYSKPFEVVHEAAKKANVLTFIEKLPDKFASRTGERGANFSGGEKQRVSIARAIYKDAPILILDEATSALDSASEAEVQKGIQTLMQGRTAFVVAHRLSTISSAHRILVLNKGEIVEQGTHQELLAKGGMYKNYHNLQVRMDQES